MLTKFQKVKESVLLTILNVILPTVDIFTDLITTSKLFEGTESHDNCDQKSELAPFATNNTYLWVDAKRMCIENSPAEGLYYTRHPVWATSLFVPFLINYLVTWVIWWSVDKRKTISWIAVLLSVYPQVRPEIPSPLSPFSTMVLENFHLILNP